MMITTKPIPRFGKEILGVDLSKPLGEVQIKTILDIFFKSGLILIRNQDISLPQFEKVVQYFGHIKPHFLDHLRLEGHPGILLLSNIFKDGKPIGVYEGAAFWHTDVAYEDPP